MQPIHISVSRELVQSVRWESVACNQTNKLMYRLFVFVLSEYGSCTCTPAATAAGSGGIYTGAIVYDCTCDDTDDCASSHVTGGKSTSLKINLINYQVSVRIWTWLRVRVTRHFCVQLLRHFGILSVQNILSVGGYFVWRLCCAVVLRI